MKIYSSVADLKDKLRPSVVTLGVFDGIHIGHRCILSKITSRAKILNCDAVVVTFEEHPKRFTTSGKIPLLVTSFKHKLRLMQQLGVDIVIPIDKDPLFPQISAQDFVKKYLIEYLNTREVVVGEDCRFGSQREGDLGLLQEMCAQKGVSVIPVPKVMVSDVVVNSTNIRKFVLAGELDAAAQFLGRPYSVLGTVVGGQTLGRRIGYPTANLDVHNEAFPPSGVYVVRVHVGEALYGGVLNIGIRTSVEYPEEVAQSIEVHIFDFEQDIYGKDIEVLFYQKLRDEQYFSDIESLRTQIQQDEIQACEWLKNK